MKKTIIVIAILAIIGLGVYYFVSNKNSYSTPTPVPTTTTITTTTTTPTTSTSTTSTTQTSNVSISIKNFLFNPQKINIQKGTAVTWTNDDSVSHTITSDSDNLLNSPTLSPGQSFSFTFANTGTINYHCNIHKTMQGTVVVQ